MYRIKYFILYCNIVYYSQNILYIFFFNPIDPDRIGSCTQKFPIILCLSSYFEYCPLILSSYFQFYFQ